jgi:hypothetical protein
MYSVYPLYDEHFVCAGVVHLHGDGRVGLAQHVHQVLYLALRSVVATARETVVRYRGNCGRISTLTLRELERCEKID